MTTLIPQLIPQSAIKQELGLQNYEFYMFSNTVVGGQPAVNFLMLRKNPATDGVQEVGRVRSVGWQNGEPVFLNNQVAEAFRAANLHPSGNFSEAFLRRRAADNPLEEEPVDPVETPIDDPSEEATTELLTTESLEYPIPPEGFGN